MDVRVRNLRPGDIVTANSERMAIDSVLRKGKVKLTFVVNGKRHQTGWLNQHSIVKNVERPKRDARKMQALIERRARSTGTLVELVDRGLDDYERTLDPSLQSEWYRWETICVDHGQVISHATRALAEQNLSHPEQWCDVCREARA